MSTAEIFVSAHMYQVTHGELTAVETQKARLGEWVMRCWHR